MLPSSKMYGRHDEYQYPRVLPPSHQQPRLHIDTNDNRFSFMPAKNEPEQIYHTHNTQAYRSVPPLPTLPNNLNSIGEVVRQTAPDSQQTNPFKMQGATAHSNPQPEYKSHIQQPQHVSDVKKETPHRPDPIKSTTQDHRSRMSIGPDENPLSPSTASYTPMWTPKTTNMSILPPSPNMNIPVSNYTPATPAPQTARGGTWTHSLCSCAEPSICMTSLFCPCIVYGRTQYRLQLRSERKDPTNMLGYKSVNGSCVAWSFLCGINGILTGLQRGRVRRSYDMDPGSGNFFSDCLEGCCCCCCVLAQTEKEVRCREETGRKAGGGTQEGYIPPGGMVFSPPPPQQQHR